MQLVHYTHYTQKLQVAFRTPHKVAPPWNEINKGDWPLGPGEWSGGGGGGKSQAARVVHPHRKFV